MYMDGQENEKVKGLEAKYDTDVRHGLLTTEVDSRMGKEQSSHFTNNIAKEKGRIWMCCMKLEVLNPLFFFLLYIGAVMVLLQRRTAWLFLCGILLVLFIKIKRAGRSVRTVMKMKERLRPQVRVLRDGIFKRISVDSIVPGDVIRLRKKERVPAAIVSLNPPFRSYLKNMAFTENAGKAIVTEVSSGLRREREIDVGKSGRNLMFQEILAAQGVFLFPSFFRKNEKEGFPNIQVLTFDEQFFPERRQCGEFREFLSGLDGLSVPYLFFADCSRQEAIKLGKEAGILTSEREAVDGGQLALLKGNFLKRQVEGIRVCCGLSEREKKRVKAMWKEIGKEMLFLTLPEKEEKPKEDAFRQRAVLFSGDDGAKECLAVPFGESERNADCCLGGQWRKGTLKYLEGQRIFRAFFEGTDRMEDWLLPLLSVFVFCLLFMDEVFGAGRGMELVLRASALACAGYVVGKEVTFEIFRRIVLLHLSGNRKKTEPVGDNQGIL